MQSIFGFITHPMELGLTWLALNVGSAGIGIMLFTIAVRLVLSPLQITQLRNAKAMQRLQPHIQEMKQKHGKDRTKLQEETMRLYKEHNVNPALGCLPMLLQFPILIGLFYGLLHLGSTPAGWPDHIVWSKITCGGHHLHPPFMTAWLKGCYAVKGVSHTDKVFQLFHANFLWLNHGLGLPDPLYILPLLAGLTQWIQSRMMLVRSTDPQQQTMNFMMNFMPLMIIFFATRYASGLSLYWVTSTLIAIIIQYRITGLGLLKEVWPLNRAPFATALVSGGRQANTPPRKPGGGGNGSKPQSTSTSADTTGSDLPPVNGGSADGARPPTNGNAQSGSSGARPRKKANRAKGGRSGGRRG